MRDDFFQRAGSGRQKRNEFFNDQARCLKRTKKKKEKRKKRKEKRKKDKKERKKKREREKENLKF